MSNIKDQIVTLLKQRHHSHKVALEQEKDPRSKHAVDLIARIREDSQLIELIDSLPDEICKDSLQVPETCKENTDSFTSLEEAAEKYAYGEMMSGLAERAFIAGGEWRKQQMMKEAVDYKIVNNLAAYPVIYYEVNHLGLKYGDKVKLIIMKQDDRPRD